MDTFCHAEIERDGQLDACNASPIGLRPDEEFGPWPACADHMPPVEYRGLGVWARPNN